jgi:hypothetical protein
MKNTIKIQNNIKKTKYWVKKEKKVIKNFKRTEKKEEESSYNYYLKYSK